MNETAPEHEGWPVALQRDKERGLPMDDYHRVLAYPADETRGLTVHAVQAGCDCGWRSGRIPVVSGRVRWFPFSPDVPVALEERLRELWREHVSAVASKRRG